MRRFSIKKFLKRVFTIALLAPIIVFIILFDAEPYGSLPFLVFVISLAVLSLNEFYHMAYREEEPFFLTGHFITITLILLAFFSEVAVFWKSGIALSISIIFVILMITELIFRKIFFFRNKLMVTLRGIVYIGWFYSYFILIRNLNYGKEFIFYVLFTIWALDSFAYLVGMFFGKHKLNEFVSPKKTIEGALGGFLASVIVSVILLSGITNQILPSKVASYLAANVGFLNSIILGAIIGVLGQIGDLYESLIKRTYGAKDSSNILPGHGGILDRADSFIILAPIVYYYLMFING